MPAYPLIFIGVGTSGLRIIEQTQRFYYFNAPATDEPSEAMFVYIETDPGTRPAVDRSSTQRVQITSEYPSVDTQRLITEIGVTDWIPNRLSAMRANEPLRAGSGIPAFGRFILRVNFSTTLEAIRQAIHTARTNAEAKNMEEANRRQERVDTPDPIVFITGSLTGGTGAGIFIDVACMVNQVSNVLPFGLFLMPPSPTGANPNHIQYGNAYGALKALALFDGPDALKYNERFPGIGEPYPVMTSVFRFVQLLSQTYRDGRSMPLSGLFKTAGLFLYLNRMGFIEKWLERFRDAEQNSQVNQYGTFGLSGVHFPKADIIAYVALELGTELVERRWLNPDRYFSTKEGKFIPINDGRLERVAQKDIDELFRTVFGGIRERFSVELKKVFGDITKRDADIPKILTDNFSSTINASLYNIVRKDIGLLKDELINRIAALNREKLNVFESVILSEKYLGKLGNYIRDVADFWGRTQGVNQWQDLLEREVDDFPSRSSEDIKRERLYSIFELLNKHFLREMLIRISDYVLSKQVNIVMATTTSVLPYVGLYNQIRAKLTPLVGGKPSDENKIVVNFDFAKVLIKNEVDDTTVPFQRVYPLRENATGFDIEVELAILQYTDQLLEKHTTKDPLYSYNDLSGIKRAPNDFWEFLTSDEWSTERIFDCVCDAYEELLQNRGCVPNYDVTRHLRDNIGMLDQLIRKANIPILHLSPELTLNNLPDDLAQAVLVERIKVVLGARQDEISTILARLQMRNILDFPNEPDHMFATESMENFTFFFKQFANFKPLSDLIYIERMERMYKNGSSISNAENQANIRERTAYYLPNSGNVDV